MSVLFFLILCCCGAQQLGFFLRDLPSNAVNSSFSVPSGVKEPFTSLRLIPGVFKDKYHFDGLAVVMKLTYDGNGTLQVHSVPFLSEQFVDWGSCIVYGVGGNKLLGDRICFQNPVVNLLPINDQLWLTIDTYAWGRVDPVTLATIPASTKTPSTIMNAHPACDPVTGQCFVQGSCEGIFPTPYHHEACVFGLTTTDTHLIATVVSRLNLHEEVLLQHSHSLCLTPNFLVAKLDRFHTQKGFPPDVSGMLAFMQQEEESTWLLMDRKTNASRLLNSEGFKFVNNHFWNCYEDGPNIVVESVTATGDYLDQYFASQLALPTNWSRIFHAPKSCLVPTNADSSTIVCSDFLPEGLYLDYPTYNPLFKTKPYTYFYAIAAVASSKWFDRIVKINHLTGKVVASFRQPNIYYTEADFLPSSSGIEDDGLLSSISYNATSDQSFAIILRANDLSLVDSVLLPFVVPFHAHGIVCTQGGKCFTNP